MPVMFIAVLALVGGFFLCLVARAWLKGCEDRRIAAIAREEQLAGKRKKR